MSTPQSTLTAPTLPPQVGAGWRYSSAIGLLFAGAVAIIWLASVRNGLLYLIGAGLGATLVLGQIGFTGSWRAFIVHRRAAGLITTLGLLALASLVFIPTLANLDGTAGNVAPVGVSLVIGAFLFGIGMQFGNGCGSGNLVGAGKGAGHSLLVLAAFLPGSLLGSLHLPWWLELPNKVVHLPEHLGVSIAVIVQIIVLAGLIAGAVVLGKKTDPEQNFLPSKRNLIGAVVLVGLAWLALFISGRMWSITFGHALWGAKIADLAGLPIAASTFWSYPYPANALSQSVLADVTSVMNLGLLVGVAALTLIQSDQQKISMSTKQVVAAILGGLLMGYGARLAFGCNIGALFSGTASGSLHAWLWLPLAWGGCIIGIKLRPRFDLQN